VLGIGLGLRNPSALFEPEKSSSFDEIPFEIRLFAEAQRHPVGH
jgi:hypothetical protein